MDLKEIKQILKLMDDHDLEEMELEIEGRKFRFKKSAPVDNNSLATPVVAMTPVTAVTPVGAAPRAPAEHHTQVTRKVRNTREIASPMVGTFYRAPDPNADPFVEVGDQVTADSVVCIIEAMKVMNEIKAEVDGEVVDVLVENGEAVEYDQALFVVKPA